MSKSSHFGRWTSCWKVRNLPLAGGVGRLNQETLKKNLLA
jgi:hypothetical protein